MILSLKQKKIKLILLILLLVCASCTKSNNEGNNDILTMVKKSFSEEGVILESVENTQDTFSFSISKEKTFEFNEGRIIVFYDYKDPKKFRSKIHGTLSEIDFNYTPISLSGDNFFILFIPHTDNEVISEKVERTFANIQKE